MPHPENRRPADAFAAPGRVARPPAFPPSASQRTDAIVLVHGAWVGEWCWTPILPALRAAGRPVHAVSLRGHGARRHEAGPHITLDDHVQDLVGLVEAHDLSGITLVAHSYGGRVATRALPRLADRVRHLVYLDAHAPLTDSSGNALVQELPDPTAIADASGMVPFGEFEPDPAEFGGDDAVAWFRERVVAQSAATLRGSFHEHVDERIGRTYVHATGERSDRFRAYAAAAAADPRWNHVELPGSHWLMISHPDEIAAIILDADSTRARDHRENASCR